MSMFNGMFEQNDRAMSAQMFSVTTGKVVENWNEDFPGMVKVEIFIGEEGQSRTDWVRVAQPYAGKGRGMYFLPEVGDEVVLAFNLGNRDHPIVIGSLWNQVDTLPEKTANEQNSIKRLLTKGGHELIFDEKEGEEVITLHTPGNLTLLLEDKPKSVTLKDGDGKNILVIDGKGGVIKITADKKVILDVGGSELTLDGQGKKATLKMDNINIEAGQALTLKGQNVKLQGAMVKIEASGNLDASANGVMNLKGSMTKIN